MPYFPHTLLYAESDLGFLPFLCYDGHGPLTLLFFSFSFSFGFSLFCFSGAICLGFLCGTSALRPLYKSEMGLCVAVPRAALLFHGLVLFLVFAGSGPY